MVLIWLRCYPTIELTTLMFDFSMSLLYILINIKLSMKLFRLVITLSSAEESMKADWPELKEVFGFIDGAFQR